MMCETVGHQAVKICGMEVASIWTNATDVILVFECMMEARLVILAAIVSCILEHSDVGLL